MVKRMAGSFEKEALPRLKQIENLRSVVATDLQEGVRFLERMIESLERYSEVRRAPVPGTPEPDASVAKQEQEEETT